MTTLGILLEAAAKKKAAPKKNAGVKVSVTVGGQGASGNQKKTEDKKQGTKKAASSGSKKTQNPEVAKAKTMRELLGHADQLAAFHRVKGAEHIPHEEFHKRDPKTRHLAVLHQKAREGHEQLRQIYLRLGNESYRLSKPKTNKEKEQEKAAKTTKAKPKAAKKKKTLKEMRLYEDETSYQKAKAMHDTLEQAHSEASKKLQSFPRGPMGLTPDHVKASPEYRAAKSEYDTHFSRLRNFNQHYTKAFAKELAADRLVRRKYRLARRK